MYALVSKMRGGRRRLVGPCALCRREVLLEHDDPRPRLLELVVGQRRLELVVGERLRRRLRAAAEEFSQFAADER